MAKTIRNAKIESRTARAKLPSKSRPHWQLLEEGLHLGYRKPLAGTGSWIVRVRVGAGYRESVIGPADDFSDADGTAILNWSQAQAKARAMMVELAQRATGSTGKGFTVQDAVDLYLGDYEAGKTRHGGKDLTGVRTAINAFIVPTLGKIECAKLTRDEIEKWRDALVKRPPRRRSMKGTVKHRDVDLEDIDTKRKRQATTNRHLTLLKSILNRAFRADKIPSDAAWKKVEPFHNTTVARQRYLTLAEIERFLNACEPAFRSLAQAALATGARYGELGRLVVSDFNADTGRVHVQISKSGKGRHIILSDEGKELFESLCSGRAGTETLLLKENGAAWVKNDQVREMSDAMARAKITPEMSFHGLRHTAASHWVMNGAPLVVVAENLGHRDTRMCELHYAHLADDYKVDIIKRTGLKLGVKATNVKPIR